MIRLTTRVLIVAAVAVSALLANGAAVAQTPTASDPAAVYQQFLSAINRGDAAAATAVFTDDAQMIGVPPNCIPTPCRGKAAIQAELVLAVGVHLQEQLLGSIQVSGNTVVASLAQRADALTPLGISRIFVKDTATIQGDKISRLELNFDMTDPQTARAAAALTAPPPAPAAAPASTNASSPSTAGIRPPATGDAGLAATRAPFEDGSE